MSMRFARVATDTSREPAVVVSVVFCSSGTWMAYSLTARPMWRSSTASVQR
jgi:hypothetical protein